MAVIIQRLEKFKTFETILIVDCTRALGETLGQFIAAVSGDGNGVDLQNRHGPIIAVRHQHPRKGEAVSARPNETGGMESVWHATEPRLPAHTTQFPRGDHLDTVIAGAGLTGLTTAVLLARAGHRVAVLEARQPGAGTTGSTTGKLSLLQGRVLSGIRRHHTADVLRAYVDGNRAGQAWLLSYLEEHDIGYERRDAFTYATTDTGRAALRAELDACRTAGLPVTWTEDIELPFRASALRLPDQAQVRPLQVLDTLHTELVAQGGLLCEGVRVTGAKAGPPVRVLTDRGELTADRMILATGAPILDRGGYFAKLTPLRSYAATYRTSAPTLAGLYLSAEDNARSLRTVLSVGGSWLMVGGNGHITGRAVSPAALMADLDRWTAEYFTGAERVHRWSAQDYQSINRVPFVGELPRGGGNIFVATGFNKWGLTNAVAAGLNLSTQILGEPLPWADKLSHRVTKPAGVASVATLVGGVAAATVQGWIHAELQALPAGLPTEGTAHVGRGFDGSPEAISTVAGRTCRLSAVCSHLGGVVGWNDAELTWDCPLHGSRFAADGTRLEGPAVSDLPIKDRQ